MWWFCFTQCRNNISRTSFKELAKACGIDQISAKFLKDGTPVVAIHLADITKLLIKLVTFLLQCKITKRDLCFTKEWKGFLKGFFLGGEVFFLEASTNIGISRQSFVPFSFDTFATLVQNFNAIPSASPKLLNLNQEHDSKELFFLVKSL